MNLSSTLNNEIIRIFATLLLPGVLLLLGVALIAGAFVFPTSEQMIAAMELVLALAKESPATATVLLFSMAVPGGLLAETIGARFEYHIGDCCVKKKNPDFDEVWGKYLKLKFEKDPIGQSYLRYLHLHLKFELNSSSSLFVLLIAIVCLHWQHEDFTVGLPLYLCWIAAIAFLLWESVQSGLNLHSVRKRLVDKYYT